MWVQNTNVQHPPTTTTAEVATGTKGARTRTTQSPSHSRTPLHCPKNEANLTAQGDNNPTAQTLDKASSPGVCNAAEDPRPATIVQASPG